MKIYMRMVKAVAICNFTIVGTAMSVYAQPNSESPEVLHGVYQCLTKSFNNTKDIERLNIQVSSTISASTEDEPFCEGPNLFDQNIPNNCADRRAQIRQIVESQDFNCESTNENFTRDGRDFHNLLLTCQSSAPALNSLIYKICGVVITP